MTDKTAVHTAAEALERVYAYMTADYHDPQETDPHGGNWGMDMERWDWNPGVGLIAVADYYQLTGEGRALKFLADWMERHLPVQSPVRTVNATSPFAVLPQLHAWTGHSIYKTFAIEWGEWLLHEAPRTASGAIQHTVKNPASVQKLKEQVWADTIFMGVLFLARLSRLTGDPAYYKEALRQLDLHFDALQDPQTGVLFHGYNCATNDHLSAARWARGNAWIVVGTPMIAAESPNESPLPDRIQQKYRTLVDGLLRYQGENGLWPTVMDHPAFCSEASGSAGIAAGILKAVRAGLLDESYTAAAACTVRGLLPLILPSGEVTSVSGGTPIMNTIEDYNKIPCIPTQYGQGLTLMLLAEMCRNEICSF